MVKSIDFIDESIFNCLGADDYAVFMATTGLCDGIRLNDGVVWVQYNNNNEITAIVATGKDDKRLVFSSDNADIDELQFIIGNNDKNDLDKKYLLKKNVVNSVVEKGIDKSQYGRIKNLNRETVETNGEISAFKMILNSLGKCEGALISVNDIDASGGFITFSQKISLITDIYTNEQYRNKGYGKAIVEKLLNLSVNERVYLISKEHNLDFYKKCGFEIVKEIYV
ncbi:MAG: GNAT family N-acetyltransferase [Clostridia bacterium]|nr:GNAT family N-acetyltransferase [Clostridia bacterium]